jgi:glucosamine--fructose-6-phosphate aminotransferase (isomerizing)
MAHKAVIPVIASQFVPQYLPTVNAQDVGLFVSKSGETKDVLNALHAAETSAMSCFGLANVIGSTLTRAVTCWLPLCCGYEISVPATKTFTNQVITFLYLAHLLAGRDVQVLDQIPELMEQTLKMTDEQAQTIAAEINAWNDLYCLGYGATYPIALEGALKLKEITYAHCEGMLSTEFKHGPLSAVTKGFPVLFAIGPQDVPQIISGINEVTCRGGRAIAVGQQDSRVDANASGVIRIPTTSPMISSLLAVLPLQLISYYMSIGRGYDPDFPRNLSKTLTVD